MSHYFEQKTPMQKVDLSACPNDSIKMDQEFFVSPELVKISGAFVLGRYPECQVIFIMNAFFSFFAYITLCW